MASTIRDIAITTAKGRAATMAAKDYGSTRLWDAMWNGNTWADYSKWDKRTLIEQGYERNPPFAFAANMLAQTAASIPIYVEYKQNGRTVQTYDHPILSMLERGDDAWEERLLMSLLYEIVCGEAYDLVDFSITSPRRPLRLIVMPSQFTDPIRGGFRNPIRGYRYQEFATEEFAADEVIMYKRPSLSEYFHGQSVAVPLAETIDLFNFATTWNKNIAMKGGYPPIVAKTKGDQVRANQFKKSWESQGGANRVAELRVIPEDVIFEKIHNTPHEAEWKEAILLSMRVILMGLGVSSSLANDAANKTYSNYQEARRALYLEGGIPLARKRYAKINRALSRYYTDDPEICLDVDKIDAIQEDRHRAAQRVSLLVKDRILTPKQGAEDLGYSYEGDHAENMQNNPIYSPPPQPPQP